MPFIKGSIDMRVIVSKTSVRAIALVFFFLVSVAGPCGPREYPVGWNDINYNALWIAKYGGIPALQGPRHGCDLLVFTSYDSQPSRVGYVEFAQLIPDPDEPDHNRMYSTPYLSPDGTKLLYSAWCKKSGIWPFDTMENFEIFVSETDGTNPERLTRTDNGEIWPIWSPDGERIAFAKNMKDSKPHHYGLYTMAIDGSDVKYVTRDISYPVFWSPEGKRFAIPNRRTLSVIENDGSDLRIVADIGNLPIVDSDEYSTRIDSVAWSPDGKTLAFDVKVFETGVDYSINLSNPLNLYTVDINRPGVVRFRTGSVETVQQSRLKRQLSWSSDGKCVDFNDECVNVVETVD